MFFWRCVSCMSEGAGALVGGRGGLGGTKGEGVRMGRSSR